MNPKDVLRFAVLRENLDFVIGTLEQHNRTDQGEHDVSDIIRMVIGPVHNTSEVLL
jgi:hypothetical protein